MVVVREKPSPENAPSDSDAGADESVMQPTEIEDLDEPLDPVIGIVLGVVGGLVIWLLILFVYTQVI
jgi:hypothetical protein